MEDAGVVQNDVESVGGSISDISTVVATIRVAIATWTGNYVCSAERVIFSGASDSGTFMSLTGMLKTSISISIS